MALHRALALLIMVGACTASSSPVSLDASMDGSSDPALDAATGDMLVAASPPVRAAGECEGLAGYEAHAAGTPALDWSRVHASVRFFGMHEDPYAQDVSLVAALGGEDARPGIVSGAPDSFEAYAMAGPEACYVGDWPLAVAPPRSEDPAVQWVAPGGAFMLAEATEHLLVDLRNAPEGPALDAFLSALLREAVEGDVSLRAEVRVFDGMRDEAWAPTVSGRENVYRSTMSTRPLVFAGTGRAVRLGFLLGDRLAPAAARLVLALRAAGTARLLGQSLTTRAAEMLAMPAAVGGFAHRALRLRDADGNLLPDQVQADVPFDALSPGEIASRFVESAAAPAEPLSGPATRQGPRGLPAETRFVDTRRHEGTRQAALIATHGAATLFFPYWDVVDTDPDARLAGALALAPLEGESDVRFGLRSLGYLAHALADSHGFTYVAAGPPAETEAGRLPVFLDTTAGGEPVVRLSNLPDFLPGDVIEEVDGVAAAEAAADYLETRASSASSAARNGLGVFSRVEGSREYTLRSPSGEQRTVRVRDEAIEGGVPTFPSRGPGPLSDLGHPELVYVDLSAAATDGPLDELAVALLAAEGVIFDMRGYPGANSWRLMQLVLGGGSPGAVMRRVYRSPLERWVRPSPQRWPSQRPAYDGPVAILTGPTTQSAAEHIVLTLQAADRVTVVGRPSAGANGNITSIALPGGYAQAFTGMIVLRPDGSVFHGEGVRVDEPVAIEARDLAAGIDAELERAIAVVRPAR